MGKGRYREARRRTGLPPEAGVPVGEDFVAREREKARELRQSQWWRNQIASGVCHYCGRAFKPSELTMDHVIPVARGGRSERGNVVPCCKACNTAKKNKTQAERILDTLDIPEDDPR